jgi:hypothetical protein
MQAEVYDAALLGRDLEAVGVQIEHFWPHLVITACETATATSAWAVLRAAKRIVPGVITVMSGPSAGPDTDDARYGVVADFDLRGSDEMTEAEVLAGLREGERPYGSVTPSTRGLGRLRALSAAWLFIAHGR